MVPENLGILKRIKSNDVALFLPEDILVFNRSSLKDEVLVIVRVWVIAEVHPVDISPVANFSWSRSKSKSNMNRVNPKFGTTKSEEPKFSSTTGFLPVLVYEFESSVSLRLKYDLKIDIN